MLISAAHLYNVSEATGVNFSDSNSSTVAKFLNAGPDPGSVIFQIWESDFCLDSCYHMRTNIFGGANHFCLKLPKFVKKKLGHHLCIAGRPYFGRPPKKRLHVMVCDIFLKSKKDVGCHFFLQFCGVCPVFRDLEWFSNILSRFPLIFPDFY